MSDYVPPDRCKLDPDAVCRYWHLKLRGLNGGRAALSQADLAFVGVGVTPPSRDGWHAPDLPASEPDDPTPEDAGFLRGLITVGQSQLDFLA